MSEPLRIGVAGFGRLAREYYLPALRTIPGVRVVAVADPLPESRAAAAARLPSLDLYPDPPAMLERARLDALLVASPPSSHLAIWKDAAARGLAVFMEKPFVLSAQLPQLEQANASARLMLDFNRRFWPTYRRVGELVRAGTLGEPVEVDFLLHTDVLSWSTVTQHRLEEKEGGILHDLGGHAIDLASDLLRREPETVAAEAGSRRWRNDHVRLALAFADGSAFRCELAYGDRTRERISILGPRGRLHLADPNMAIHVERNGARESGIAGRLVDGAIFGYRALRQGRTMSRSSIRGALASFVRALREDTPFSPGFEDAVRNALWVEAAARSAADGGAATRPR